MVLFTARRRNTFVGGTCAPPSALLVQYNALSQFNATLDINYVQTKVVRALVQSVDLRLPFRNADCYSFIYFHILVVGYSCAPW